jgi:hypothetical protein
MEMNQQDAYYSMMHGTYNVKLSNPMSKAFGICKMTEFYAVNQK